MDVQVELKIPGSTYVNVVAMIVYIITTVRASWERRPLLHEHTDM